MAPPRGAKGPKALYTLGQKGRKTGVDLPDTGQRDQHGMMNPDIFSSSPARPVAAATPNGARDQTGEQDMEMDSAGPGPTTVLRHQHLPRGRSPAKTNLKSPAVRNPRLGIPSSPTRGTIMRQDDEDDEEPDVEEEEEVVEMETVKTTVRKTQLNGSRAKNVKKNATPKTNGNGPASAAPVDEEEKEEESILQGHNTTNGEDSMQLINESLQAQDDEDEVEEEEDEEEVRPARRRGQPKKGIAKSGKARDDDGRPAPAPGKQRGRPPKNSAGSDSTAPKKRTRTSDASDEQEGEGGGEEEEEEEEAAESSRSKRQKTSASAKTTVATKKKMQPSQAIGRGKRGRKANGTAAKADTSLAEVQRGPPLPRSRGLVSIHRDASGLSTTRSGRHSIKPLEFWRGERVEFEMSAEGSRDAFRKDGHRMVLPTIKEVIRVERAEASHRQKGGGKSRAGGGGKTKANSSRKRARSSTRDDDDGDGGNGGWSLGGMPDEEDLEDWELVPGRVEGEVVVWSNDQELSPPAPGDSAQVLLDNIAVSANGVVTKDIKYATFQFAKTMSTPFMGTGIVDLPPGAEKKTKNSRKMQMAFFVFFGKVVVNVHETVFTISAGGHWFVPRGNYYSIRNDCDHPARIFFAQACEVAVTPPEDDDAEEDGTLAVSHNVADGDDDKA